MTKTEREKLERAIRLLFDNEWDAAMNILMPMAGLVYPANEITKGAESIPVTEVARGPNQPFQAVWPPTKMEEPPDV